jgi:hypothetical protein
VREKRVFVEFFECDGRIVVVHRVAPNRQMKVQCQLAL